MNEPTECAQKVTGKITAKDLLSLVKFGTDRIFMHGYATPGRASYSDSFVFDVTAISHKSEKQENLLVPGWVSNGSPSIRKTHVYNSEIDGVRTWNTYEGVHRPEEGFWSFFALHILDLLEILPPDAEISFHVSLDGGTSELLVNADCKFPNGHTESGLHGDRLYLCAKYVRRGKEKCATFMLDSTVCAHNSARFGVSR